MTKKRRIPGSAAGTTVPADPRALPNDVLALLLTSKASSVDAQVRGIRARHPTLTSEQAFDLLERCAGARDAAFAMVAATIAEGAGSPQAAGRILAAYPWMSLRNIEAICADGFVLAIM
jgi:hypothetical protein